MACTSDGLYQWWPVPVMACTSDDRSVLALERRVLRRQRYRLVQVDFRLGVYSRYNNTATNRTKADETEPTPTQKPAANIFANETTRLVTK